MSLTTITSVTSPVTMSDITTGSITVSNTAASYGTIAMTVSTEDLLDKYDFNKLTVGTFIRLCNNLAFLVFEKLLAKIVVFLMFKVLR